MKVVVGACSCPSRSMEAQLHQSGEWIANCQTASSSFLTAWQTWFPPWYEVYVLLWEEKVVINSQWPDCKRYIQKTALPSKNLTPTLLKLDTKLSVIRSCEEVIASSHRNGFSAWKTLHGLQPAKDSNKVHLHLRLQGQHFSFENILLWSKYWSILGFTILLQPLATALRRDYHYSSNTPEKHKIQTNVEASNWSWAWGKQTILQGYPEWMSKVKQFQTVCTGVVSLECSWMRNTGKFILWNIQNHFSLGHWVSDHWVSDHWVSDHWVTRMFNRLQNAFRLWKAAWGLDRFPATLEK